VARRNLSTPLTANHIAVTMIPHERNAPILPRKGLQLPQRLPFDKWLEIGYRLSSLATSSAWCLGDWLVYGEVAFTDRYRKAVDQTSLDYQTLRNYAWVSKRFDLSRRRDSLSFGHHAEVAALPEPEQDYWLRKAEELSWSRNHLRIEVQQSRRERERASKSGHEVLATSGAADGAEGDVPCRGSTLKVNFSSEQIEICQAAASARDLSLEDWALCVLEEAARSALGSDCRITG
jgi:hypothetical protein